MNKLTKAALAATGLGVVYLAGYLDGNKVGVKQGFNKGWDTGWDNCATVVDKIFEELGKKVNEGK